MGRSVSFEAGWRGTMPRQVVALLLGALLPLLVASAVDAPTATGIIVAGLLLAAVAAVGLGFGLAALAAVTNRRLTCYRRRDGVEIESNDPPVHPVRPRAPGLA